MPDVETLITATSVVRLNVADRLASFARQMPDAIAVACPRRWSPKYSDTRRGKSSAMYATTTFAELDANATRIARGVAAWGVPRGTRLALLVRPGIEFVSLVFGLLRAGMVIVLVDLGLGKRNLIRCLAEAESEGFVAVGLAQAARVWLRRKFPRAKWNVTVGRRWFWGGLTLNELRSLGDRSEPKASVGWDSPISQHTVGSPYATHADDPAAIIFTSGSTGPPKGVLYTQRMFDTQVAEIQATYDIEPGGVDLACFPLFALFNSAMGVTTVLPEMDFSRPASADPAKLLSAANDWQVTQAFASPAVWRVVSEHCARTSERIDSLWQVFSCGAPVPADVLHSTLACVGKGAKMHTPYGATECLPVATIEAAEVLGETAARTDEGAGVCVGRKFDSIEWRVIRITDEPIATIGDAEELPTGEIGELIVRGLQVSPEYVTTIQANTSAKISDPAGFWHRTGDVGYFDVHGRFWYCGRNSHRVETADGPLYTECVEAVFNAHPDVKCTALVGLGSKGRQLPVAFYQLRSESSRLVQEMANELHDMTQQRSQARLVRLFAEFDNIPVDIRHNAKILRETMAEWATELELTEVGNPTSR